MQAEKIRVTYHNARTGASAKHNDRKFDVNKTDHISLSESAGNKYWTWDKGDSFNRNYDSFEGSEMLFYYKNFKEGLDARNRRYLKEGHPERTRSLDEYYRAERFCPEETLFYIGDKDCTASPAALYEAVRKTLEWQKEMFPNLVTLNVALHVDEEGAPHVHERHVWIGHDDYGYKTVNQNKALKEMGIECPNPDMPENRYNNSKVSFTMLFRNHFIEVCQGMGFDVELVPREASRNGRDLIQYQYEDTKDKLDTLNTELDAKIIENTKLDEDLNAKHDELDAANDEFEYTMKLKIEASKIRHKFGDKENVFYHKDSIEQANNIAICAREYRDEAKRQRYYSLAEKREGEKLKEAYGEGIKLKEEYEEKLSNENTLIESRAKEIADDYFNQFIANNSMPDRTSAMEKFISRYTLDGENMLALFNKEQEEERRNWESKYYEDEYDWDDLRM